MLKARDSRIGAFGMNKYGSIDLSTVDQMLTPSIDVPEVGHSSEMLQR